MSVMTGDGLFPFPSPDFLFVHTVNIHKPYERTHDNRGRKRELYEPAEVVRGYLTAPDAASAYDVGAYRVRIDAVLLLPKNTCVCESAIVVCNDPQLPMNLAGQYRVDVVRPNISHTRCLLFRYTDAWDVEPIEVV